MMDCLFCKIAHKEIESDIIYQDDHVIAISDLYPKAPVHKLIIPFKHIATLNDLTEDDTLLVGHMIQIGRQLAAENTIAESGYRLVFNCNADGGQEIFHIHLHLLGGRPMHVLPG